jgi:hypothetical protein
LIRSVSIREKKLLWRNILIRLREGVFFVFAYIRIGEGTKKSRLAAA